MNPNERTAVRRCREYDAAALLPLLREMAQGLGIGEEEIRGRVVAIKPNLLLAYPPEKAATTHPAVVAAAARLFSEWGAARVLIAESPGGIYNERNLDRVYTATGMKEAAEESGAELNRDLGWLDYPIPDGRVCKTVSIIRPIAEADVIVNLCKLKTHALAVMTAAAKNLFGVIPGIMKFEMHARFKKPEDFFSMVIDLDEQLSRTHTLLNLCDGIVGMEGDGPSGGTPKEAGVLLMSRNPFCLDLAASRIMGLEGRVPLLEQAAERGFCPRSPEELAIVGEDPGRLSCAFALPDAAKGKKFALIPPFLQPRPVIDGRLCRGCGMCVKSCPRNTIVMKNGKALIRHERCIRCYCCQELCTFRAVKIKKSFLYRLVE